MKAQGWQVESHDLLFGGKYDVCKRVYVVAAKRRIYLGLIGCILLATECTTWSSACHPAYRSPSYLPGLPTLTGDRLERALSANCMMRRSAEIFAYALQFDCQVWLKLLHQVICGRRKNCRRSGATQRLWNSQPIIANGGDLSASAFVF